MKEKTATFIGHRQCTGLDTENLRNEIEGLVQKGVCNFLNGGMGSFDWTCARIVHEMREKYPQIRSYLVIPYLSFRVLVPQYFDEVIYPEGFEKYHYKAAIVKRNQYLVEQSSYALCFVTHNWGGAAKTYQRAVKKGLTILNLGRNV